MHRLARLVAPLLLVSLAAGCSASQMANKRLALRDCRFTIRDVRPTGIDLGGARFRVVLRVENPNDIEVVVDRCDFDFGLDGRRVFQGSNLAKLSVPPGQSRDLPLEVVAPYQGMGGLYQSARGGGFKTWDLRGQVYVDTVVGSFTFPLTFGGKLP